MQANYFYIFWFNTCLSKYMPKSEAPGQDSCLLTDNWGETPLSNASSQPRVQSTECTLLHSSEESPLKAPSKLRAEESTRCGPPHSWGESPSGFLTAEGRSRECRLPHNEGRVQDVRASSQWVEIHGVPGFLTMWGESPECRLPCTPVQKWCSWLDMFWNAI